MHDERENKRECDGQKNYDQMRDAEGLKYGLRFHGRDRIDKSINE